MMNEDCKNNNLCLFFVSDYHFEMISLPYISKSLKENKDVIIVTENNLIDSINKIMKNINLTDDEKEKIMKINWNHDDKSKLKYLEKDSTDKKEKLIFVKGTEEYVKHINQNIKNLSNINNIKIVDCFDINEVKCNIGNIVKNYDKILSTSGIEKLV